ncbi:hypothetical protein ONS95_010583 [Cadophora gregata]|uniref:uncharacterized protein n=1 Tax=Cadophora gregata TaxID=51156 RepID=UPI0026DB40DC|nr:uncharacterized protein ONS95_010583 [Cadophora gregata]KAK0122342.1 hypothetical protein ONS95_010583 [Cadophora gregata]
MKIYLFMRYLHRNVSVLSHTFPKMLGSTCNNDAQTVSPSDLYNSRSQQFDLPLQHGAGVQSEVRERPSSPDYEPFGPRKGNLQDSLLNQPVQASLRMVARNLSATLHPEPQQHMEQYQHSQAALPSSTPAMG